MIYRMIWILLFCCVPSGFSGVVLRQTAAGPAERIILENSAVQVALAPALGGRVSSYLCKSTSTQWIASGNHGLFIDHVTQQAWPGELMDRKYDYEVISRGPEKAEVTFRTVLEGKGDAAIRGLRYVKTYSLAEDSAYLKVIIRLENPTREVKRPGLWVQNIPSGGSSSGSYSTCRPTAGGPLDVTVNSHTVKDEKIEFRFDPVAGWTAKMDPALGQGLVFFMDYNYLKCLYSCMNAPTAEWWFYPVSILPGKTFETEAGVWPVSGLSAVTYASPRLISNIDIKRQGKSATLRVALSPGPRPEPVEQIAISLLEYPELRKVGGREIAARRTIASTEVQTLAVDGIDEKTNLLARVTVSGKDREEKYERFSAGVALLGCEASYRTARPAQHRPIDKPDKIVKYHNPRLRIFHIRGLFQEYYRWDEIARGLNAEIVDSDYSISIYGDALSRFPVSYDELMRYDVIVVNHVPWNVFSEEMVEYLTDFVTHGGILWVTGGPMDCFESQAVPAKLMGLFPVVPTSENLVSKMPAPEYLDASRPEAGAFAYACRIAGVKPGATVRRQVGKTPVLVYWKHGEGGAFFFTPLVLGPNTANAFWTAREYPSWMADQIRPLVKCEGK